MFKDKLITGLNIISNSREVLFLLVYVALAHVLRTILWFVLKRQFFDAGELRWCTKIQVLSAVMEADSYDVALFPT